MCNCLFCGQEIEVEENVDNPHVCPPDENLSLQSVRVAMNNIFENEDDGWEAWAQLVEWLNKQSAQHRVHPTSEILRRLREVSTTKPDTDLKSGSSPLTCG